MGSLASLAGGKSPSLSGTANTAMSAVQTCKDVGNTMNKIDGTIKKFTGTWQGSKCDKLCKAQGGKVCGMLAKDCCAMECI